MERWVSRPLEESRDASAHEQRSHMCAGVLPLLWEKGRLSVSERRVGMPKIVHACWRPSVLWGSWTFPGGWCASLGLMLSCPHRVTCTLTTPLAVRQSNAGLAQRFTKAQKSCFRHQWCIFVSALAGKHREWQRMGGQNWGGIDYGDAGQILNPTPRPGNLTQPAQICTSEIASAAPSGPIGVTEPLRFCSNCFPIGKHCRVCALMMSWH